ncbi:XrtA system polysaccharide chain length determinant [Kineobactrum salinum]|uniref:Chain length-determining protein n=1 Tax=Kineobactrum salinum TaxID=2708301 RepID=A0A6C0U167_9GAMM|nr:XrtA system polysaccharide chain length determinant [Kineobactrum salinum]QIB64727.1 chain length-determining protein [Kineobactrum salinum]
MQDAFAQVLSYALGVWRHRWLALGIAWVIALAGWAYVWQMPESYVASARVYVDTNSVLRPLMRGLTITPDIDQRIRMMSRTLLSRPNLEKLARMTDLDLQATTEAQKDALIKRLENSISLLGNRGNASLYSISVKDRDRETARRIAQSLITVFIETSMSDKRQDSSGAKTFLEQQLAESEARLIEAEARLANFKQRNVDVLPGEQGDYYSRLMNARSNLEQARLQLREVENRRLELQRQIAGEEPVFIAGGSSAAVDSPIGERIQALTMQMDNLMSRYTEKHPEVLRLRGLIAELEAEQEAEYSMMREASGSRFGNLPNNPVYQGMRSMLAETEAQAAELRVRVAEYERRVEELGQKVNQIPEVEAELKQLDRDYNVIARQHQEMLERREAARLAGDVENTAGDVTFRVIDPPFVPRTPNEPNKLLLNAGVLVVALGAGGALALLLSLLYPMVTDARMLANTTGLPLLGTVAWNKSAEEKRSDVLRLASFSICSVALLLAFAGVLVVPGFIA